MMTRDLRIALPSEPPAPTLRRAGLLVAILLAAGIPAPVASASDWPQYGFSARHGSLNPAETVLGRKTVAGLRLAARLAPSAVGVSATSPSVAAGRVHFGVDTQVYAFDTATGGLLWSRPDCSEETATQPTIAHERVFVGDAGGDWAAYDAATGAQAWCADTGGSQRFPSAAAGAKVYATNGGDLIGATQLRGPSWWYSPDTPVSRTPAVADGVVSITGGGVLHAVSTADGGPLWQQALGGELFTPSVSPDGAAVYVGASQSLFALDRADGAVRWQTATIGTAPGSPAIYGNRLFVNGDAGHPGLWALDSRTGDILWHADQPGASTATASVAGGVVYDISDRGELQMFHPATLSLIHI